VIRTSDKLLEKVGEDLIWRRKELTELKGIIEKSKDNPILSRVLLRTSVAILYAHWEGFVKKSSQYYLEYVASQRLPYEKLTANFIALTLKSKFSELGANVKLSAGINLANFFCNSLSKQSNIPYKSGVDTQSNLSSTVLIDIITILGLDISGFETRFKFIDSNLVNPRNHIAHGQKLDISINDYQELHVNVLALIEGFRNEIENASITRKFEKKQP
jgi:hypothetical protein